MTARPGVLLALLAALLAWWVLGEPDAGGRGLATEATRLVAGLALGELGLRRVHLEVAAANAAAIAVYERSGFVREGGDEDWVIMARRA